MEAQKLSMDYYKGASDLLYVHSSSGSKEAQQLHVHDFYQIYYILRGDIAHWMRGQEIALGRGDTFIIPPGCEHNIVIGAGKKQPLFFSFSFLPALFSDPAFWSSYPGRFLLFLQAAERPAILPRIALPPDSQLQMEMLMTMAEAEFVRAAPGYKDLLSGILTAVLTLFARVYFDKQNDGGFVSFENYRQTMLYCIEYVKNNFHQELSLDMLAKNAAMSLSNFCRLFKQMTGLTFHQYLTQQRIDHACQLLKTSVQDISFIAYACGYRHFSSFYRAFSKQTGVSPSEYRKLHRTD